MVKRNAKKPVLAGFLLLGASLATATATWLASSDSSDHSSSQTPRQLQSSSLSDECSVYSLPKEALDTIEDINSGGPYNYPNEDNGHFGNYEGVLPKQERNFYRSYTVTTPGLTHRGPRRIVTGGGTERDPSVWYYTDDHYETFCEIPDADT